MPLPQSEIRSILFVCWGNICRSPSAENVMRALLERAGRSYVRCDSAGTMDAHRGNPPDPRMSAAGKRRGLPMTGSARGIKSTDFQEFDLILAMDQANFTCFENSAGSLTKRRCLTPTTEVLAVSKTCWISSRTAVAAYWWNSAEININILTNRIANPS